jgi:ParB family transcriptional regulator, chromosome partitioning protein
MNIQAGVNKTMVGVLNEINKATQIDPRLSILRENVEKIVLLPIKDIKHSENIRTEIDVNSDDFKKLVESIKLDGVIQNLVVELRDFGNSYELMCVAGHRRLEAAKQAGIEKVNCLIQKYSEPSQRTRIALAENMIRESLHPLDVAEGFNELIKMGWTEDRIAEHYERDIKTIKRYLNISNWRDDIKELVFKHKDIFTYSVIMKKYALRAIVYSEQQETLKNEFDKLIEAISKQTETKPVIVDSIAEELKKKLSLKVELKERDSKGKLSISFNNEEEKNKILNLLGLSI